MLTSYNLSNDALPSSAHPMLTTYNLSNDALPSSAHPMPTTYNLSMMRFLRQHILCLQLTTYLMMRFLRQHILCFQHILCLQPTTYNLQPNSPHPLQQGCPPQNALFPCSPRESRTPLFRVRIPGIWKCRRRQVFSARKKSICGQPHRP